MRSGAPSWLALLGAGLAGVASAAQSAANGELGTRVGNAALAAVTNNLGGTLLIAVGLAALPPLRARVRTLRRVRLPWWTYLGGLGGAVFVATAAYVVPTLGVALFTVAQVAGSSAGGLLVDRIGLAPVGRLPWTGPRLAGALLGIIAVTLSQVGHRFGALDLGALALALASGAAIALQSALNGRVSAAADPAAATVVNFAVGTPALALYAAVAGSRWPGSWPAHWYLYLGGLLGVGIVTGLVISVRAAGVLRTGLAAVAGQLAGGLALDVLLAGGRGPSPALLGGAALTVAAVAITSYRRRGPSKPVGDCERE